MADIRECRRKIDKIDSEISRLLDARRDALEDIAHYKRKIIYPCSTKIESRKYLIR